MRKLLIAHRGNINGPNPKKENEPYYVLGTLNQGFYVELDVWYDKGWWSGHDGPTYKTNERLISKCLCHAKNVEALYRLRQNYRNFHFFWHEDKEDYTLTSQGLIFVKPGAKLLKNSICVMPELGYNGDIKKCYAICTDFVQKYALEK